MNGQIDVWKYIYGQMNEKIYGQMNVQFNDELADIHLWQGKEKYCGRYSILLI